MPPPRKTVSSLPEIDRVFRHEYCWAKTKEDGSPGINVLDHCLNVGCVAEQFLALFPPQIRKLAPKGAATLAALHDVGKVSPGFQVKCESWVKQYDLVERAQRENWSIRQADHAKVSQYTVQLQLKDSCLDAWAAAVGAHHGRIKGERVQLKEPWELERSRLAKSLIYEFGPLPSESPKDAALWFVAGLITVSDWIGSDERQFPQDVLWSMPERRGKAAAALAAIPWQFAAARPALEFDELFPSMRANALQVAVLEVTREPGVYVIEGPMGYGKTEAALAAAYRLIAGRNATGFFFALPTQVTSSRIHLRVRPFVDRISAEMATVRLAHSASWLVESEPLPRLSPMGPMDHDAQETVRSWFASAKRALLAPFGVGTIDQALLGIIAVKHFFVRQFGLAGKVVILDEVHTYDLYTSTLVTALVKRLRELQCTVIVLSATLTEARRRELLDLPKARPLSRAYPLVSAAASSFIEHECEPPPSKTVHIRNVSNALSGRDVLERARRGECVLWIRNTVDLAQETYSALRDDDASSGLPIALLHSRFPFFRREELENDWMERLGKEGSKRPAGCVLVSTQVAEQSVDIDADLLISDLAPTDMLLQRLGRLWRHARSSRVCSQPEVWIQMPEGDGAFFDHASGKELKAALGKNALVYAPYVLLRSLEQWRGRATVELPGQIRQILEATYADPATVEPVGWQELRGEMEEEKEKMASLAVTATAVWHLPPVEDEEGVHTRYSKYPTAQLLLAYGGTPLTRDSAHLELLNGEEAKASSRSWDLETAKAIHRNVARIPLWAVANGTLDSPSWLTNYVSQPAAFGVVAPDGTILRDGKRAAGLSYSSDQGVIIDRKRKQSSREDLDESLD